MSGRMVRLSKRAGRKLFAGYLPIDLARNPAMAGYKLPNQRREFKALNVMGVRIWVNKPRAFKGKKWRARRATVAAYCQ